MEQADSLGRYLFSQSLSLENGRRTFQDFDRATCRGMLSAPWWCIALNRDFRPANKRRGIVNVNHIKVPVLRQVLADSAGVLVAG